MASDTLKQEIIQVMYRQRLFGSNHRHIVKIMKSGFRSDQRGEVKKIIKELITEGLVVYYDRARNAIQLNKERIDEIEKIMECEKK